MQDQHTPLATTGTDLAMIAVEADLQEALELAIEHLSRCGYQVDGLALAFDGVLPDGDAFSAVRGTPAERPESVASLLAWASEHIPLPDSDDR